MHAFALLQIELERVELAPRHLHRQARAVVRILEREEHRRPPLLAPELRHFALDPERGEAVQPRGNPLVERPDAVDLPSVDLRGLDLHPFDRTQDGWSSNAVVAGRVCTKQCGRVDRCQGRWALVPGETAAMRRVQAPSRGGLDPSINHLSSRDADLRRGRRGRRTRSGG